MSDNIIDYKNDYNSIYTSLNIEKFIKDIIVKINIK